MEKLKTWATTIATGLLAAVFAIFFAPALVGFAYPFFAVPFYGMSCAASQSSSEDAWVPRLNEIRSKGYRLFLRNEGCDEIQAARIREIRRNALLKECRERMGNAEFERTRRGLGDGSFVSIYDVCAGYDSFFEEDIISGVIKRTGRWLWRSISRSFLTGLDAGVTTFTGLYNANIMARGLLVMAYLLIAWFAMKLVSHLATDAYLWARAWFRKAGGTGPDDAG